jgi:Transposase IS116/IS110/IS902 family
MGKKLA